jgi:hypothetical protein
LPLCKKQKFKVTGVLLKSKELNFEPDRPLGVVVQASSLLIWLNLFCKQDACTTRLKEKLFEQQALTP